VILSERHLRALEEKGGRLHRYTPAHEIGHWDLHAEAIRSGMLRLLPGGRTWCRASSPDLWNGRLRCTPRPCFYP
jgi:hypothetical protein